MNIKILISFCFLIQGNLKSQQFDSLETYYWIPVSDTLAIIDVPPNYKIKNWFYGEGVLTNLVYSDSSKIFLHFGGCVSLPFCQEPDCIVKRKFEVKDRIYRSGILKDLNLYWREENHVESAFVNIGFVNVHENNLLMFNRSLDSFKLNTKFY